MATGSRNANNTGGHGRGPGGFQKGKTEDFLTVKTKRYFCMFLFLFVEDIFVMGLQKFSILSTYQLQGCHFGMTIIIALIITIESEKICISK